jgi:hypothetical protein
VTTPAASILRDRCTVFSARREAAMIRSIPHTEEGASGIDRD